MRLKRWQWIVLGSLVALMLVGHLLFGTAAAPGPEYVIDLGALHRAATASGALPESIEVEKIGTFAFPRTLVVAGDGFFRMHDMVLLAHRVVGPSGTVVIDTAMSPAAASVLPGSKLDPAAFEVVEAALKKASAIVFTHEHSDHVGGIAAATDFAAIAKQIHMTREQLTDKKLDRAAFGPGKLESLAPLDYSGLYTLAPGIVLQKAPGHTTGSQLIYVELANGNRFLFVGDIAWTYDNIALETGRPGIAKLLMNEDRSAVAAELRALHRLPKDVHVILSHDPVALAKDLRAGLYREGFSAL